MTIESVNMDLTNDERRYTEDDLRPILQHLAIAASHAHDSWEHVEAAMLACKENCPGLYEELLELTHGQFRSWQTVEHEADEVLGCEIADYVVTGKPLPPKQIAPE